MSLKVWIPGTTGTLKNQGLLQLPSPSYNATSEVTSGKLGKAIQGLVCYHLSSDPCPSLWSVACWSKFTSGYSPYNNIILCLNTSDSEDSKFYLSIVNNTTLNIGRGSSSTVSYALSGNFQVNTWYHLAATFDGTTTKLYLNGSLVNSSTGGSTKSALNLTIGGRSTNANGTAITGTGWATNDVRIYDHCLTPQEVKEISKGLVCHYTLGLNSLSQGNNIMSAGLEGWDNSGTASRNSNDTSYSGVPGGGTVYSITKVTAGLSAISVGSVSLTAGHYYRCTCWVYCTGSDTWSTFYVRQSDTNLGAFKYNGIADSRLWPRGKWIPVEVIVTPTSTASGIYFCDYIETANSKKAYTGWLVREIGSGLVYDSSGYSRNLTITGNVSPADSVRYDKCIWNSAASGTYLRMPMLPLQLFTYSFWVKRNRDGLSNREMVMTGWYGLSFEINSDDSLTLRHYLNSTGTWDVITTTKLTKNNWYHIVFTRDASGVSKIYVNGALDKSGTNSNSIDYQSSTSTWMNYSNSYLLQGGLSDVRVYATALSADDVKDLYNLGASIS